LSDADLSWANLSQANLSGADLSRANLSTAILPQEAQLYDVYSLYEAQLPPELEASLKTSHPQLFEEH